MQRKKLATKIASVLLSATMLVSSAMTAFATEEAVSVAAEQTEVQTVAETEEDVAPEASAEDAAASEELTEGETVAEEEITTDEVITEESATEEAQENVEAVQVLDAEEAQVLDADEVVAVADENDIALVSSPDANGWYRWNSDSPISYKYVKEEKTLYFQCDEGKSDKLPDEDGGAGQTPWVATYQDDMKNVEKVVIGEGITEIGKCDFDNKQGYYPNLKTVVLPSSVTKIGDYAFRKASNLSKISASAEGDASTLYVKSIGKEAFLGTGITSVRLENNVEIGYSAFQECQSLTTVVADGSITLSDGYSFSNCQKLTNFKCTEMKKIPAKTFYNCSALSTWSVPGVEEIGYLALYNCSSLTSFTFDNVTSMSEAALQYSGITLARFDNADLDIDTNAFMGAKIKSICYAGTKTQWDKLGVYLQDGVMVHHEASSKTDKDPMLQYQGWTYCDACGYYYLETDSTPDPEPDPEPETETETEVGHQHSWSNWKTTSKATVFKAEVQTRTCSKCGKTETTTVGKKLTPTITVNARKIWLQKGQKTSAFKVSGLANGDSVKSYKSSNKKIFTVTNKGVIKAGKKVGKAKLTITLASGKKKVVTVQVLNRRVKTRNITNLPAKVTLKKGATYTLSPVVIQITSTHKLTYTSSNKKVATVTKAGKIKGVKKGTATIKVKSGTVTKKVKVTVK